MAEPEAATTGDKEPFILNQDTSPSDQEKVNSPTAGVPVAASLPANAGEESVRNDLLIIAAETEEERTERRQKILANDKRLRLEKINGEYTKRIQAKEKPIEDFQLQFHHVKRYYQQFLEHKWWDKEHPKSEITMNSFLECSFISTNREEAETEYLEGMFFSDGNGS